jgi:hypothetical protein
MNDMQPLDRQTADMYAAWFRALADGTCGVSELCHCL